MKCFYHRVDLDGKCSAAIIYQFFQTVGREIDLYGINYGESFPWDSIEEGETVYMVDFSLQPFEGMIRLNERAKLIWIDHHKTALEEYTKAVEAARAAGDNDFFISGLREDGIGACALVWRHMYQVPPHSVPRGIQLLAEHDVWKHENPLTLPFQSGMRFIDPDPQNWPWHESVEDIANNGNTIIKWETQQNKIRISATGHVVNWKGLRFLAANYGPTNSQLFDSKFDPELHDAMMPFYWARDKWRVSLYSPKDGPDMSVIAKEMGGGGHEHAAGFQCQKLPWLEEV